MDLIDEFIDFWALDGSIIIIIGLCEWFWSGDDVTNQQSWLLSDHTHTPLFSLKDKFI